MVLADSKSVSFDCQAKDFVFVGSIHFLYHVFCPTIRCCPANKRANAYKSLSRSIAVRLSICPVHPPLSIG